MDLDGFLDTVMERLREEIPGAEIKIQQVNKLQGASYTGISVRPEGAPAAVTFNPDPDFESFREDGSRMEAILERILDEVKKAVLTIPDFEIPDITDYSKAKDHLMMQVVPAERNREMLESIPHRIVEDLAVVYRVEFPGVIDSFASTLVTDSILEGYGISADRLHEDAVTAQKANHPPVLKNISEMLGEMTGGLADMPESPMWVATAGKGINGASVIQIPEFLEESAAVLGGDYFILPSSIHEVMFIKDDGTFEREALENMVRSVNETEVSEADYLSDSVYHYDSRERVFEKAQTFESRSEKEKEKETITVLLIEPDRYPKTIETGTGLEDLQNAVGGRIEVTYPFDDPVGLIMNEDGKLDGLPLNRALRDDEGRIYDVVAGPFLVAGLTEDSFGSLTPEQISVYEEKFHFPEVFVRMGHRIIAVPAEQKAASMQETDHRQAKDNVR